MVIQTEIVRVNDEVVLRGNSAMLKCAVPSYVADFVTVDAWLDDRGGVIMADGHIGNHPPDPPIPPAPPFHPPRAFSIRFCGRSFSGEMSLNGR